MAINNLALFTSLLEGKHQLMDVDFVNSAEFLAKCADFSKLWSVSVAQKENCAEQFCTKIETKFVTGVPPVV